jgi:SAM-dependent methyltransferase
MGDVPTSRRDDRAVDGYEPGTYGDAFADVYDEWYADVGDPAVAAATLADLAGGGPVLELGVGSGRLAIPLARTGTPVWGIDASPSMLARLGGREGGDAVRAVHGDMTDPGAALAAAGGDPPRSFSVVVAAFNTFFLLPTEDAQRRCLHGAAELLAPAGVVVLECFVPGDPPAAVERVLEPRTIAVDHVVFSLSTHDPVTQVVRGQHVELRETGTRLRPWVVRYATPDQLDELAAAAGLRLRERWAGWDRGAFDDRAAMHVSVYESG